jgi:thiosulfate dehydrogenase [quinone] large subunit
MSTDSNDTQSTLGLVFATLLLRLWLGFRALQTGIEKFAGKVMSGQPVEIDGAPYDADLTEVASSKGYALDNYHGIPESMRDTFAGEPLMMAWALKIYDFVLGPALIILGLTILLGIASRVSLFLLGLIYISLTWGLILIKQDSGIAWLGIHVIIVAMALNWANHNRLCILKKW